MARPPNLALDLFSVILVCVCAITADAQKECQEGDPLGATYLGKKSVTASGLTCQVWATSTPHKHQYTDLGDHNHCRNPDESFDGGVWCYTTDPNKRWELCDLPTCVDCVGEGDPLGEDYLGFVSVTSSGLTCQAWSASEPHKHGFSDVGEHNHCRNPDGYSGGAWCYTSDPGKRWEVCEVPRCEVGHVGLAGEMRWQRSHISFGSWEGQAVLQNKIRKNSDIVDTLFHLSDFSGVHLFEHTCFLSFPSTSLSSISSILFCIPLF